MNTIKEIKDRIYQDFITSFNNAITPLWQSLFEQFSNVLAGTFNLVYIFLNNIQKDSFLTTCTQSRVLSYFAPLKKLSLKEASQSKGIIRFTGIDGSIVPINTKLTYNQLEYKTIEEVTVAGGFVDANSQSVDSGLENNTIANIDMFLSVPIDGINNKAISILGFNGAADDESVESLRTRTKQKFATLTQVDNDNFYKSLANEVSNIKASFISDNKNGVGTFGVTVLTIGNNGVPVQTDIDEVEQYFINNNAVPVYVTAEYFIPTISYIDFTIQLSANSAENQTLVSQAITDYLYLVQKPSTTLEWEGLADFLRTLGARLITPTPDDSYIIQDDEVLDIGVITWN